MKLTNDAYNFLKRYLVPILAAAATFVSTCGKYMNMSGETIESISGILAGLVTAIMYVINESSTAYFKDKQIIDMKVVDYNEEGQG